jgi:hypothetical protein
LDRHTVFLPTTEHARGSDPWHWDHGSPRVQTDPVPALPGALYLSWSYLIVAYLVFLSLFIFHRICCSLEVASSEVSVDITRFGICIFLAPLARILMADMKSHVSAPLPYKRVSSPAHFRSLVPGRQKAMEVSV